MIYKLLIAEGYF